MKKSLLTIFMCSIFLASCGGLRTSGGGIAGCPGNSKYLSGIFKGKFRK